MQHQLSKGPLLDNKGNLNETGYSFYLDKVYDRKAIKKLKGRIKEWDYYYIGDEEYGIALTIDDNSYMGLVSVSVLDYKNKTDVTKSYMFWLPFGEVGFRSSSKDVMLLAGGLMLFYFFILLSARLTTEHVYDAFKSKIGRAHV